MWVVLDAHLAPQVGRLLIARAVLVAGEHGEGEAVLVDAQPFRAGQKLPAPGDGFLLEVIAQRPVAQHFKEGEVAGVAHVVDVAGADALLHIRQPRAHGVLRAQQIGDQRVHAGGGEQNRGVVFRDQRSAGDDGVVLLLKELQKQAAQVVGAFDVDVHAYLPPDSQKMKRLSRSRTKRRVSRYHPDWPSKESPLAPGNGGRPPCHFLHGAGACAPEAARSRFRRGFSPSIRSLKPRRELLPLGNVCFARAIIAKCCSDVNEKRVNSCNLRGKLL